VLGDRALLVTELVPKSGLLRFRRQVHRRMTEHVCPAQIPPRSSRLCLDYALRAHRLLGCRGTSRSDFRWDDEQGAEGLFLLETNTQPG
jgi:D-alanine-D-alanine ligase